MANLKKNGVGIIVLGLIMAVSVLSRPTGCSSSQNSGKRYTVGNNFWTIPANRDHFSNWSSSHFFQTGDSLVFKFETGHYNVLQVSRHDYNLCEVSIPINVYDVGPVTVPLTEAGDMHFICNIGNYCEIGMKITVTVNEKCNKSNTMSPPPSSSPATNRTLPNPKSPPSVTNSTTKSPVKSAATTSSGFWDLGGFSLGFCSMMLLF